ncbi:unnamed protein product [Amoebophrya sp. A25]|nr:unnamed protein product [Amoebophrya sp. A25]|eukprot:GSA25T00010303001.1
MQRIQEVNVHCAMWRSGRGEMKKLREDKEGLQVVSLGGNSHMMNTSALSFGPRSEVDGSSSALRATEVPAPVVSNFVALDVGTIEDEELQAGVTQTQTASASTPSVVLRGAAAPVALATSEHRQGSSSASFLQQRQEEDDHTSLLSGSAPLPTLAEEVETLDLPPASPEETQQIPIPELQEPFRDMQEPLFQMQQPIEQMQQEPLRQMQHSVEQAIPSAANQTAQAAAETAARPETEEEEAVSSTREAEQAIEEVAEQAPATVEQEEQRRQVGDTHQEEKAEEREGNEEGEQQAAEAEQASLEEEAEYRTAGSSTNSPHDVDAEDTAQEQAVVEGSGEQDGGEKEQEQVEASPIPAPADASGATTPGAVVLAGAVNEDTSTALSSSPSPPVTSAAFVGAGIGGQVLAVTANTNTTLEESPSITSNPVPAQASSPSTNTGSTTNVPLVVPSNFDEEQSTFSPPTSTTTPPPRTTTPVTTTTPATSLAPGVPLVARALSYLEGTDHLVAQVAYADGSPSEIVHIQFQHIPQDAPVVYVEPYVTRMVQPAAPPAAQPQSTTSAPSAAAASAGQQGQSTTAHAGAAPATSPQQQTTSPGPKPIAKRMVREWSASERSFVETPLETDFATWAFIGCNGVGRFATGLSVEVLDKVTPKSVYYPLSMLIFLGVFYSLGWRAEFPSSSASVTALSVTVGLSFGCMFAMIPIYLKTIVRPSRMGIMFGTAVLSVVVGNYIWIQVFNHGNGHAIDEASFFAVTPGGESHETLVATSPPSQQHDMEADASVVLSPNSAMADGGAFGHYMKVLRADIAENSARANAGISQKEYASLRRHVVTLSRAEAGDNCVGPRCQQHVFRCAFYSTLGAFPFAVVLYAAQLRQRMTKRK